MHLVGDFDGPTLKRWAAYAEQTNRTFKHTTLTELDKLWGEENLLIIMDEAGLNEEPME